GRVNATHQNGSALQFRLSQDPIPRETITSADSDADDISRFDDFWVKPAERFVNHNRVAHKLHGGRLSDDKEPSGSDDAVAHRLVRRINQNDLCHRFLSTFAVLLL